MILNWQDVKQVIHWGTALNQCMRLASFAFFSLFDNVVTAQKLSSGCNIHVHVDVHVFSW